MGRRKSKKRPDAASSVENRTSDKVEKIAAPRRRRWIWAFFALVVVIPAGWFGTRSVIASHWGDRATAALQSRQLDLADQLFATAHSWSPAGGKFTLGRARAARLATDPDRARTLLDEALMQGASDDAVRREQLLLNIQGGRAREMYGLFERLLGEREDDRAAVWEAYAIGFDSADDPESARQITDRWLAEQPDSALSNLRAGTLAYDRNELESAESFFRAAVTRDPDLLDAWLGLARTATVLDRNEESLHYSRQALQLDPENVEARLRAAKMLQVLNRKDEAIAEFERVLKEHPDSFSARFELVSHYSQTDKPRRVIELLEPVMHEFAEDVALNYLMATAHQQLGNDAESEKYLQRHLDARAALDKLTELEMKTPPASRGFEFCKELGLTFLRYQWDSADHWLNQALSINPTDHEIHRALGDLARKRGDEELAARFHQAAEMLRSRQ